MQSTLRSRIPIPLLALVLAGCTVGDGAGAPGGSHDAGPGSDAASDSDAADESGAGEGEPCNADEDCSGELACVDLCDDSCDQTVWPNPCCTRTCVPSSSPWACEPAGGVAVLAGQACPSGYVAPAVPEDWVTSPSVFDCCLPDHACADLGNRTFCDALPGCVWVLSGRVGLTANDGTCEPLP
jgi:hypothetical protein